MFKAQGTTPFPAQDKTALTAVPCPGQRSLLAGTEQEGIEEEETQTLISTCLKFGFFVLELTRAK